MSDQTFATVFGTLSLLGGSAYAFLIKLLVNKNSDIAAKDKIIEELKLKINGDITDLKKTNTALHKLLLKHDNLLDHSLLLLNEMALTAPIEAEYKAKVMSNIKTLQVEKLEIQNQFLEQII